jgi:hypothetical protein
MRKIVRACAGHVSIRTNSVCKELEPAGGIKSSAAVVNARSCAMRVTIRTSSVCKELGHVGATTKPADKGRGHRRSRRLSKIRRAVSGRTKMYPRSLSDRDQKRRSGTGCRSLRHGEP